MELGGPLKLGVDLSQYLGHEYSYFVQPLCVDKTFQNHTVTAARIITSTFYALDLYVNDDRWSRGSRWEIRLAATARCPLKHKRPNLILSEEGNWWKCKDRENCFILEYGNVKDVLLRIERLPENMCEKCKLCNVSISYHPEDDREIISKQYFVYLVN
jgi:hypothetical protein